MQPLTPTQALIEIIDAINFNRPQDVVYIAAKYVLNYTKA